VYNDTPQSGAPAQADDLYELITERVGAPLVLTSNRTPQHWYPLFPNPVVAESLLDRLINNRHWPSAARGASSPCAWPRQKIGASARHHQRGLRRSSRATGAGGVLGNVNPIGPRSIYDESKPYAEALFMVRRRARGVDTGIPRIFNPHGPGLRHTTAGSCATSSRRHSTVNQ
jgi:IstB-like ATP binding protein